MLGTVNTSRTERRQSVGRHVGFFDDQRFHFLFVVMTNVVHKAVAGDPIGAGRMSARRAAALAGGVVGGGSGNEEGHRRGFRRFDRRRRGRGRWLCDAGARRAHRRCVPHRRRRRLGGWSGSVHPAPQAAPRRQRHGVRPHPAPRPHTRELPRRSAVQGHGDGGQPGRRRHRGGAEPRLRHPARRGHLDTARPAEPGAEDARRSQVTPVHRSFSPLARRRTRQPRDRRRAVGKRLGRDRRPAGHQGGERHHLRAGPGVGEVRRDAAQRGRPPASSTTRWRSPSSPASWCA